MRLNGEVVEEDNAVPTTRDEMSQLGSNSEEKDNDNNEPFTRNEMQQLYLGINQLERNELNQVVNIIFEREPSLRGPNPYELDCDLKDLKLSTFRELEKFVLSCLENQLAKSCTKKVGGTSSDSSSDSESSSSSESSDSESE